MIEPSLHLQALFLLPYAVTPQQYIVYVFFWYLDYLRICRHHLVLQFLVLVILEWEITERPRDHQVTIHSPFFNESTCLRNPLCFFGITRSVILAEDLQLSLDAGNSPAVSSIGHIYKIGCDQASYGGGS